MSADEYGVTIHTSDLTAAEHDIDGLSPGVLPQRSLVICTTPAGGGDLAAERLRLAGAGVPAEYLDLDTVAPALIRRWGIVNLDDYIAALHHHRSTSAGIFAVVMHWHHVRRLHRQVAGLRQLTAERILDIVGKIAPEPTVVFAHRDDLDRQAVALYASQIAQRDVPYDGDAIAERRTTLEAAESAWIQWFDAAGIQPLDLTYGPRDEAERPLRRLLDQWGLPFDDAVEEGSVDYARSEVEAALLRRFHDDLASRPSITDDVLVP
jgi:LPS sulfotransferase NodH